MNYMVNQIVDPENGSNENFTNGNFTIKLKPWPPPIKTDGGLPLETTEWPHTPIAKPEPTQSYSPVPPLPSIMNSPFAPAPVQSPSPSLLLGSPGSRPSTANRTAMHRSSGSDDISAARSHYSTFQQSNLCSASMVSTNPTPTQASSVYQDHWQVARSFTLDYTSFPYAYNQRLGSSPLTSSVYSPCSLNGTSFATSSVRPFRVVGQTPPSGQGG